MITTILVHTENFWKLAYGDQSRPAVPLTALTLYQLCHKGGTVNLSSSQILEFRLLNPLEVPVASVQCSHKSCSFVWEFKFLPIQDRKRWLNRFRIWALDLESKRRTTDLSTRPLDSHKPELYRTQSKWQKYFPVYTTKYQHKEGWNTEHKIRTHDFMIIIRTCSDELKQCALAYKNHFLQTKWTKDMISTPESTNYTVLIKHSWLK